MNLQQNISLKTYNTFGINAKAAYFLEINSVDDLKQAFQLENHPNKFVLSGGSNLLLTNDLNALVLHINIKGKKIVEENDTSVVVNIMAGENWHNMVLWALQNEYGGLENMSLIPGNTGTAPIQNIGAYGVELKDVFKSCEAMNTQTLEIETFSKKSCQFGYRNSYFKNEGKGKYIITSVNLKLTKKNHKLNTSYGAIEDELKKNNISQPTIQDISKAVIAIRKSKLPNPAEIGNSGSFFKNPVLNASEFKDFSKKNPEAPFYKVSENEIKVPSGWLIEQCGFKGKRVGDAGVHKKQALVLVNHGNATGKEILNLSQTIREEVFKKFGIRIIPEVNIIK
ncbi:UDP-N-acetylmuramate dehydrogenase [Saonia flava]|uniref:UDP-N-acetylenolpyruvoylglucosamine reductase n=1 Tax=Saonia flava TaxID=523696 RepID=A0A846QUU3_9FLAO|nr:UDP-N-acetylmuramate dehydrogenase [Saonia flava]NJB70720.1 UDP-N-acetylmuramate dehydrogenase [Saonia flava]